MEILNSGRLNKMHTQFDNKEISRYELRRIEVFGSDRLWNLKQKLKFGTNDDSWTLPAKYYLQRALSRLPKRA